MHEVNIKNLDLNLLVALEALLQYSSVSKAALAVNLSQPAMSRALDRLRHMLKDPLLVRSGRGMILTPRAELLKHPLEEAMIRVRGVFEPEEFIPATAQTHFRIMVADYEAQLVLPKVLEILYVQAPNIKVHIEPLSENSLAQLIEGEIDLSIGVVEGKYDLNRLYSQALFDDHFICMMRDGHPLSKGPMNIQSYAQASHAMLSVTGKGGGIIDEYLTKKGLSRTIALRLPHYLTIHSIISRTDLITTIPSRLAAQIKDVGVTLEKLPNELNVEPFTISQIWHERFHQDPARKWLRSVVKNICSEFIASK